MSTVGERTCALRTTSGLTQRLCLLYSVLHRAQLQRERAGVGEQQDRGEE